MTTPKDKTLSAAAKAALLLSVAGEDAIELFNNFIFIEGESSEDYATVIKKFDNYWEAERNEVYEWYMIQERSQAAGESFEQFIRDVNTQARSHNFGALAEFMIRDQIVIGISNDSLRVNLLRENQLTLAKAEQLHNAPKP